MRVVMLSNSFPPEIGGIQEHVSNLAQTLARQGHQLKIVTVRRNKSERVRDNFAGLDVVRVPQLNLPKTLTTQYLAITTALLIAMRLRGQADVVHYHTFWPDAFTAFVVNKFVPTVYTAHESRFLLMAEQPRSRRWLKLALRPFQGILAPSTELLEVTRQLGVSPEMSAFIANAVDARKFRPDVSGETVRARYGVPMDHCLILCPRRLVPKNGLEFLIESLPSIRRRFSDVSVLIAGDGPEREKLETRVRELGLHDSVIFAGSRNNDELPEFYAAADIVAIPSLKEATSIAGLEAMASACAVVATNVGGLPEIIEDGVSGLLVPPHDPEALAQAITRLIESPGLRKQLGLAARARVEQKFTWEQVASETTRAYERAVAVWHRRPLPLLAEA
ncbi:MAG TPA: glycosyltransferase family 4 protein [Pyrinomonadaceae bacterium]|nr:glycosyltransferase family 4 protein [Pyrinomonadaceae bacterium]